MASIEEAIATKILATAAITAIIGTRFHWFKLEQNAGYPAIIGLFVDKVPAQALGTQSTAFAARVQFDCYAKNATTAKTLSNELRKALDALDATVASTRIYGTLFLSEFDVFESDTELYRISSDFRFLYTQT